MIYENSFYLNILAECIERYTRMMIFIAIVLVFVMFFYIFKKKKVYTILVIAVLIVLLSLFSFTIKKARDDFENQTIIIEEGTIQHNVSDSFILEDVTFYPSNSNESILLLYNEFLMNVECPYGNYSAVVVYGENSKILLFINTKNQSDETNRETVSVKT